MSGHIIGAPPEKRGATFADIAKTQVFDAKDPSERASDGIVRWVESRGRARQLNALSADWVKFPADWPVIPLALTPVEPEPDPAVTTYGELKPGQWFVVLNVSPQDDEGVHQKGWSNECTRLSDGKHGVCHDEIYVRVLSPLEVAAHILDAAGVAASVVVHEEPGRFPLVTKDGPGFRFMGIYLSDREQFEHALSEAAHVLAQRDASPASEPEPSTWYEQEASKNGHAVDCDRRDWDTNPCTCEPAEDRSKPAPGFSEPHPCWLVPHYPGASDGQLFIGIPQSQAMIEASWAQHDAQQTGNGGES